MLKGILLGMAVGLVVFLLDYWTFVRKFPVVVLYKKMSVGLRALVCFSNMGIECFCFGLIRHRYILLPDMADKSFNDSACWFIFVISFLGAKAIFFVIPAIKLFPSLGNK